MSSRTTKFRQDMQLLGVVQIGVQVPKVNKEEVQLFAAKLRFQHYLRICEKPITDRERIVLADRNSVVIPNHTEMGLVERSIPTHLEGELKPCVKAMREHVTGALRSHAVIPTLETQEEEIKWKSLLVAHSHAAKYYREYIDWAIEEDKRQAMMATG